MAGRAHFPTFSLILNNACGFVRMLLDACIDTELIGYLWEILVDTYFV